MSEADTRAENQQEQNTNTVAVNTKTLETLINAAESKPPDETSKVEAAIADAESALEQFQEAKESVYFLDQQDEHYGYAIYNTHEDCFVPLPGAIGNPSSSRSPVTPNHVANSKTKSLLHKVAHDHGLDQIDHLRVVRVTLDNELDRKATEYHEKHIPSK